MSDDPEATHPDANLYKRLALLEQQFRPAAPVDSVKLLKGRTDHLARLMGAVNSVGEHAVIYGEPGVGKTSLALVTQAILLEQFSFLSVRLPCTSEDTFSSIWKKFQTFSEREIRRRRVPREVELIKAFEDSWRNLSWDSLSPADVFFALDRVSEVVPTVVVVDEFDRIADWETRSLMSNLIKMLSDERVASTVLVVGVADDVDEIVAEHRSVERNLLQLPMPRLSAAELEEILESGFKTAGLTWSENVSRDIARVSRGLPHYVHLMGRHIGRATILAGMDRVADDFWIPALEEAVAGAQETISRQYDMAVFSHRRDALYEKVLLACAITKGDEWGYFLPSAVRPAYSLISGAERKAADYFRHLQAFTSDDRGVVLETRGEGRATRYKFKNPLLQPYIILRGLHSEMITRENIPPLPSVVVIS